MGALYSVGTWDTDVSGYTPQPEMRCPCINVTWRGLLNALRELRNEHGYDAGRVRFADGSRDSDWSVLVERTDGLTLDEILRNWERW